MNNIQKTLFTATVAVLVGAGIFEARQAAQLREQNQTLQQQQAEQLRQLQRERQQFRQDTWARLRTNTPDADEMALSPPPNFMPIQTNLPRCVPNWKLPPAMNSGLVATNSFVKRVCVYVDILVAAGQKTDAEKIRDEAVAILDDPRLKSAVSDAERKIGK